MSKTFLNLNTKLPFYLREPESVSDVKFDSFYVVGE